MGLFHCHTEWGPPWSCLLSSSREIITERGRQELLQQTGRKSLTGLRAQESRGGRAHPGLDERKRGLGWRAAQGFAP